MAPIIPVSDVKLIGLQIAKFIVIKCLKYHAENYVRIRLLVRNFLGHPLFPRFCGLECHFLSFDADCEECHAQGRQCFLNPEYLVVLSAGPIFHNTIQLLIIATDFIALS